MVDVMVEKWVYGLVAYLDEMMVVSLAELWDGLMAADWVARKVS